MRICAPVGRVIGVGWDRALGISNRISDITKVRLVSLEVMLIGIGIGIVISPI